jgi:hypothetical protein
LILLFQTPIGGFNYQGTSATLLRDGLKEMALKEKLRSEDLNQEAGGRRILRMDTAKHRHPPRKFRFETRPEPDDFNASAREVKN